MARIRAEFENLDHLSPVSEVREHKRQKINFRNVKRSDSLANAPYDVRIEIEQRELEVMAAEFAAMPEPILQSMAFSAFVDWFRTWFRRQSFFDTR